MFSLASYTKFGTW